MLLVCVHCFLLAILYILNRYLSLAAIVCIELCADIIDRLNSKLGCKICPVLTKYNVFSGNVRQYYVQFYGDDCHYAWINEPATMEFKGRQAYDEVRENAIKKHKQHYEVSKHRICAWDIAVVTAEEAMSKNKNCRLTESASRYMLDDDLPTKLVIKLPKRKYIKRKLQDVTDVETRPAKRHKLDRTCDLETGERPVTLKLPRETDQEHSLVMEYKSDYSGSPSRIVPAGNVFI